MKQAVLILISIMFMFATSAFAGKLSVNVSMANIRSGPGTKYKVLWKVERNHPIEVIKKRGEWYYFRDFEGDKGWIHSGLVSKAESVIVKKTRCHVRSGPGTNFDIVFDVEKGVPLKVLKHKGDWIKVRHEDGDEGWIHGSLVW